MGKPNSKKGIAFDRSSGQMVRVETQSSIPVKVVYTPEDIKNLRYAKDFADPGEYPYTRGIYPEMYRNRLWIRSPSVGYSTPEETNVAFKEFLAAGLTGLRPAADLPLQTGIDPDHPLAFNSLMCGGTCFYSLDCYERILKDLPIEDVDYECGQNSISGALFFTALMVAISEKRGLDITKLRGNVINDPFRSKVVFGVPDFPTEIDRRVCIDIIEFCAKNTPKFKSFAPNGVDPCQAGANAYQELGFVLGGAIAVYEDVIKNRGLKLDEMGTFVISLDAESDFFETIAKFRAARRMWARIAKDRLGGTTPRALSLRIGIRTSGLSLQAQKPLNNTARVTLQILSCVLGGVNSIDSSTIDEAIGLPSNEARIFSLDAQHIITHEANVPLVADPLGGSYYLEWLTDELEKRTNDIIKEIDDRGGMWKCLESGWLYQQIESNRRKVQQEKNTGKRLIVGSNAFQGEEGPINKTIADVAYKVPSRQARLKLIKELHTLRRNRNQKTIRESLKGLFQSAKRGTNLVRPTIEAVKAYATIGEIVGVIRMAYGHDYDPLSEIREPDLIREVIGNATE